jgi:hypothetical protein
MILKFKDEIEKIRMQKLRDRFPNNDDDWIVKFWHGSHIVYSKGSSAPGVEKNICEYIKLKGFQAENREVVGREIRGEDIKTSLGTIQGKRTFIPSTGTKGSADISAIVYGIAISIEVKVGRDRQSEYQKKYEDAINKAGGFYFIAHDEDDFINKFEDLLGHPKIVAMSQFI